MTLENGASPIAHQGAAGHDGPGGPAFRVGARIVIPVRTVSGLNVREHWRARAARVKAEREATAWALVNAALPQIPCTVTLTRVGPSNGLDSDNLPASCKGVRDQIAKWLGIDDRSPLVAWQYSQRRGQAWAVELEFS